MLAKQNLKPTSCCSVSTTLRWMARALNAFVVLALIYLGSKEMPGGHLSSADSMALCVLTISFVTITVLYVREFSAALVVLAFGSLLALAIEGRVQPRHGLLLLLCIPAALVWFASRLETPKRVVQKQLFPDSRQTVRS